MSEAEDHELVNRCLNGDRRAFERLVDRYQKPVFNIAFRMVGRHEDAQDITQTVFLKAFQSLTGFKREYKFFSWLYRMAINESIKFVSRPRPQELIEETIASSTLDPEEAFEAEELSGNIAEALMNLSLEYRAVIILRHFHDQSYAEIACTLGISEKKVKSRLFSARQILCEQLIERGVTSHD